MLAIESVRACVLLFDKININSNRETLHTHSTIWATYFEAYAADTHKFSSLREYLHTNANWTVALDIVQRFCVHPFRVLCLARLRSYARCNRVCIYHQVGKKKSGMCTMNCVLLHTVTVLCMRRLLCEFSRALVSFVPEFLNVSRTPPSSQEMRTSSRTRVCVSICLKD